LKDQKIAAFGSSYRANTNSLWELPQAAIFFMGYPHLFFLALA
jgi:hypothetical protein